MKICSKCKIPKDLSNFSNDKNKKDGLQKYCKECINLIYFENKDKIKLKGLWKINNKKKILKYAKKIEEMKIKSGGKCIKCNDKRLYVLDFHHIDPSQKIDVVSNLLNYYGEKSWHIAEEEAKKCVLICSNCHREFHYFEYKDKLNFENYLKQ